MDILVTGCTGFLGQALVRDLSVAGHNVTALIRPGSRRRGNIEGFPNVSILESPLNGRIALPRERYDVFYHLAWEGGRNDFDAQYPNVGNTLNCLRTAADYGCGRFICTGSQAEYGENNGLITEETPVVPVTSYGAAKVAAYYLTRDLARRLGIEHVWVRPFSIYGEHDNENTLYSGLCAALKAGKAFKMQTDGKHIWNFLHETDAVRALRLLGEATAVTGVFNLASQESLPLRVYVQKLRQLLNPDVPIEFGNQRSRINLNTNAKKLRGIIGEYETTVFPYREECVDQWQG